MAYSFDVNNSTMTGPAAIFKLKELLKSVGWTVKSSSDGTTYNSTGDQITTGSSGAGGLANNSAWFRIQMPSVSVIFPANREFVFQRNSTNVLWTIRYSYSAGFTGGTPNATTLPTATDQQTLFNGTFFAADSSYRYNAAAGGASEGYSFWSGCFPSGGGNPSGGALCFMEMQSGSYSSLDADPYVIYCDANVAAFQTARIQASSSCWFRKGLTNESFTTVGAGTYINATNAVFPNNADSNPHNGNDDTVSIPFIGMVRVPTTVLLEYPAGWKGLCDVMRWNGTSRTTGDTLSVSSAGAKDRIVYRDVNLPWNGSTPTV